MSTTHTIGRRLRVAVASLACGVALATASTAHAEDRGLTRYDVQPAPMTAGGPVVAGAHADTSVTLEVANEQMDPNLGAGRYPSELTKNLEAELPPGLLADPTALPTCTPRRLEVGGCPDDTQVGVVRLFSTTSYTSDPAQDELEYPVFNMDRRADQVARLGFPAVIGASAVVYVDVRVRDESDYGATAQLTNIPSGISFYRAEMDLWGVPGAVAHDDRRSSCQGYDYVGVPAYAAGKYLPGCTASVDDPTATFMVDPTRCDVPLSGAAQADFYERPGQFNEVRSTPFSVGGCDELPFAPRLTAKPDAPVAGQPAGLDVDLRVPQTAGAGERATAHVRDVTVTLPEGTAISPSAATGLGACSDAQLGIGTRDAPACPDPAKIGTVSIASPLVDAPLTGSIYLGTQRSQDPTSGQMYRIFLVAQGSGVTVKLRGAVKADPRTGQLTATFTDNPQLPFDALSLRFDGGAHAPLVNPTTCGTKTTKATITSWAGQTVSSSSSFAIDQGCPTGGFAPGFTAGTLSPLAGAYSPFVTTITRSDADQELARIDVDLPSGLLGSLGSVPVCAEAQAAAGTCAAASRLGSTTVRAGSGSDPFSLGGTVSLAGPYKGAPFSLSIAVPAKAGPFDLGLVVVRAALRVDAAHAKVSAVSDPLPTIVGGVPLKLRQVTIALDRPGFMFNATSCAAQQIGSRLEGTGGGAQTPAVRYQADGCANLKLAPSLKIDYSGKGDLRKGKNPKLTADLSQTAGQSGLRNVKVTLPLLSSLKPENARALCTTAQAAARACPGASVVGRASARTPALHEPLSGPVYLVQGTRTTAEGRVIKTLPKLWLKLQGDGVPLDLWAQSAVDQRTQRLVTTFVDVPDAPIAAFRLEIDGGSNGILAATADPCTANRRAEVQFDGQNGARQVRGVNITARECGVRAVGAGGNSERVRVRVANIGAGKLVVSGAGVSRSSRTVKSAAAASVTLRVGAATRRAVLAGRTVRVRVTATFTPKGASKAQRAAATVTIKGKKQAKR